MVQPIKVEKVEELKDLLAGAKSIILNDFTGLDVADISELRRLCREQNVVYRVIKNTLARRSFEKLGMDDAIELLEGPTAIAVSMDNEVVPAQVLKKFADDYELPRFKGGYVSGRLLSVEDVIRLASLPGKDVLLTQAVGMFQAPMRGLVNVLGASLRDLVSVFKAISEKKEAA
ncbi:MAG: 50S ribosomal protein L10 [bacterium]|nr:MAG: 50S ribosomal protein L10 [bacterium]